MKSAKRVVMIAALAAVTSAATAADYPVSDDKVTIPHPTMGQRWILNDDYSDEFSGDKLDDNKWENGANIWDGRPPGLFVAENVSVGDGYLKIRGNTLDKPEVRGEGDEVGIYTLSCGAIGSKGVSAHYGYYETRAKANKTPLSTTFWLSTRQNKFNPVREGQPASMPDGTYHQELDFCETIGRMGSAEEGWTDDANGFHRGMNSNAHCWYTPASGGERIDMVIPKLAGARPADGSVLSDGFNTYGCLWLDKKGAEFFMNNVSNGGRIDFETKDGQEFWMSKPMAMNILVETYRWIPTPKNEELLDPTKNTSYYDWIRHYVMVDINNSKVEVAPEQKEVFEDYVHFTKRTASEAKFEMIYQAPEDRTIILDIYDKKGDFVASKAFFAYAGFGANEYSIDHAELTSGKEYTVVAYLGQLRAPKSTPYICGDSFSFTAK